MHAPIAWRRLSDWKSELTLVSLADLDAAWLRREGWVTPAEALGGRFPALAARLSAGGWARVEGAVGERLRALEVPLVEVGYHRGSDGLRYAERVGEVVQARELDVGEIAAGLDGEEDRLSDAVDALLRLLSEGTLGEADVLLAALAPALGPAGAPLDLEALAAHEALPPDALPAAPPALIDAVAARLPRPEGSAPEGAPTPATRRAWLRKARWAGALGLLVGALGLVTTPWLTVLVSPLVVLCALVVTIHTLALRAERAAGDV